MVMFISISYLIVRYLFKIKMRLVHDMHVRVSVVTYSYLCDVSCVLEYQACVSDNTYRAPSRRVLNERI